MSTRAQPRMVGSAIDLLAKRRAELAAAAPLPATRQLPPAPLTTVAQQRVPTPNQRELGLTAQQLLVRQKTGEAPAAPAAPSAPPDTTNQNPLAPAAPAAPPAQAAPTQQANAPFSYTSQLTPTTAATTAAAPPGSSAAAGSPLDATYWQDLAKRDYEYQTGMVEYGAGGTRETDAYRKAKQSIEAAEYKHPRDILSARRATNYGGVSGSSELYRNLGEVEHGFATSIANTLDEYRDVMAGLKAMRDVLSKGYIAGESADVKASGERAATKEADRAYNEKVLAAMIAGNQPPAAEASSGAPTAAQIEAGSSAQHEALPPGGYHVPPALYTEQSGGSISEAEYLRRLREIRENSGTEAAQRFRSRWKKQGNKYVPA